MTKPIAIIIVNWNAGDLLAACVASIFEHHAGLVDALVVVDNGSTDDSLERLASLSSDDVKLTVLRNAGNRGFAAACNQGARLATSKYLLFLNPDTRINAGSLSVPLSFLEQSGSQDVGVVGIQLIDDRGCVARSCSRFPTAKASLVQALGIDKTRWFRGAGMSMQEWLHDSTRSVDQVIGAFFLVRHTLFRELAGFDERFFVYFEEVDFSRRLHLIGYRSVYLADAQAYHKGGGTSEKVKAHRLFYSTRSRILYAFKHFGTLAKWMLVLSTLLLEPVVRCAYALIRGQRADLIDTCRGYWMLYRSVPEILTRRPAR